MTVGERNLVAAGRGSAVVELRRQLGLVMQDALTEAIEELTGCKVTAFMSASHLAPDLATEVFVLDRSLPDGRPDDA